MTADVAASNLQRSGPPIIVPLSRGLHHRAAYRPGSTRFTRSQNSLHSSPPAVRAAGMAGPSSSPDRWSAEKAAPRPRESGNDHPRVHGARHGAPYRTPKLAILLIFARRRNPPRRMPATIQVDGTETRPPKIQVSWISDRFVFFRKLESQTTQVNASSMTQKIPHYSHSPVRPRRTVPHENGHNRPDGTSP